MLTKVKGFTLIEAMVTVVIVASIVSLLAGLGGGSIYGWFKRTEHIGVVSVNKDAIPDGSMVNAGAGGQAFSRAVTMKVGDQFISFSTEDRQWAAQESGTCVKFSVDPYAPWQLSKAKTLYNGRVLGVLPESACN